ncbi:SGNH hydrolase-type esterase domain-containing protein [Aspergillus unguis]
MRFTNLRSALLGVSVLAVPIAGRAIKWQKEHWVATWTSMPQEVEPYNLPPTSFGGENADVQFDDATLRQTVRTSIPAQSIRVQFSNVFGLTELPITAASVAFPLLENGTAAGVGEIDTSTIKRLAFNRSPSVTIPPGKSVYSDPIDFEIPPLSDIALSIYTKEGQVGANITGHPGSRTTSWFEHGNKVNSFSVSESSVEHWYFISAIEAWASKSSLGLVILGDSITDGRGSDDNRNNRWPDALAERLRRNKLSNIAINNQAAGGNAILSESNGLGPSLITRYHRDAIETSGVKYVMIFEGVNDIGVSSPDEATQNELFDKLVAAYCQILFDSKNAGLVTIGATITPFGGNEYDDPAGMREKTRLKVNEWILRESPFDYVLDFAEFIGNGSVLKAEFDSGDHLHPNVAGYKELARRFDLGVFVPR